jgi:hypothetical protein
MTKEEAIKQLVTDFQSRCIQNDWMGLDEIDWKIAKALEIIPKKIEMLLINEDLKEDLRR